MKNGEVIFSEEYSDDHPAHYDQNVARAHDLLSKAKAFMFVALVPLNEDDWARAVSESDETEGQMHIMMGRTPGVDLCKFIADSLSSLVESSVKILDIPDELLEEDL